MPQEYRIGSSSVGVPTAPIAPPTSSETATPALTTSTGLDPNRAAASNRARPRVAADMLQTLSNRAAGWTHSAMGYVKRLYETPEPPPSTLKWPATPPLGAEVEVNGEQPLGRLQQSADQNLKDLPGMKGYLGTVRPGDDIMVSRKREPDQPGYYPRVSEKVGVDLDVHEAEFFMGSQQHGDLIRLPLCESMPRGAGPLVKTGKQLSAGADTPRLACFTQPPGSDEVHFRVGTSAVEPAFTADAGRPGHDNTTVAPARGPHDAERRQWRAYPLANGQYVVPSVGGSDDHMACELMLRLGRGETLDQALQGRTRKRPAEQLSQRWQTRTQGKEQAVFVGKGKDWAKKPADFSAVVRELRQGLHDHGAALLTVPFGNDARQFVLFDIKMADAEHGTALVADPRTATVTEVPFGPDKPCLVPPGAGDKETRLTATFFSRERRDTAKPLV